MNELKRAIGKTIQFIKMGDDGDSSYAIIKFKDGGKLNITSHVAGKGIGQLDLSLSGKDKSKESPEGLEVFAGKTIQSIEEGYDGEDSSLNIKFQDGDILVISAYSSDQESTAEIDVDIYESFQIVKESLFGGYPPPTSAGGQYPLNSPSYESAEGDPDWLHDGSGPNDDSDAMDEQYHLMKKDVEDLISQYEKQKFLAYWQIIDMMRNIIDDIE